MNNRFEEIISKVLENRESIIDPSKMDFELSPERYKRNLNAIDSYYTAYKEEDKCMKMASAVHQVIYNIECLNPVMYELSVRERDMIKEYQQVHPTNELLNGLRKESLDRLVEDCKGHIWTDDNASTVLKELKNTYEYLYKIIGKNDDIVMKKRSFKNRLERFIRVVLRYYFDIPNTWGDTILFHYDGINKETDKLRYFVEFKNISHLEDRTYSISLSTFDTLHDTLLELVERVVYKETETLVNN